VDDAVDAWVAGAADAGADGAKYDEIEENHDGDWDDEAACFCNTARSSSGLYLWKEEQNSKCNMIRK
jgi:hypothetical protein